MPKVEIVKDTVGRCIRNLVAAIFTAFFGAILFGLGAMDLDPLGAIWNQWPHGARTPGNLHVRNLDDDLIARLKRRAARHGRSTEAEHREILRQALAGDVEPSFDSLAAELRKLTRRRKQTPSEVLLREGREER